MKKHTNQNAAYVLHYFESKGGDRPGEIERAFALFDSLDYEGKDTEERITLTVTEVSNEQFERFKRSLSSD